MARRPPTPSGLRMEAYRDPSQFDHHVWLTELFAWRGVLATLRVLYAGARSQTELTELLDVFGLSEGAVIKAVRMGEAYGVLRVSRLPVAGRKYRIALTDLGLLLMERPIAQWGDASVKQAIYRAVTERAGAGR